MSNPRGDICIYMYTDQHLQEVCQTIDEILPQFRRIMIRHHTQEVLDVVEYGLCTSKFVLDGRVRCSREEKFAVIEFRFAVFQVRVDDRLKGIVRGN